MLSPGLWMFPGSNMLFWAKNWVKTWPKIAPSEFCRFCRSRTSRDRIIHAFASSSVLPCHACASSTPSRHLCSFHSMRSRQARERVTTISSISRGRLSHASASLFAGHLLNFLCSFHFCKPPLQFPSHSCPIKPGTLNTGVTESNGIKEN